MKQILTVENAEKIARENLGKIENNKKRDVAILHSKLVGDTALILAEGKQVDKNILRIAGWVHDIGKLVNFEKHEKDSIEILEKEYEFDEKLKDCILNHGSDGKPKTEEGKIIQAADKICFLNIEMLSLLIKYTNKKVEDEDIKFISKVVNKAVNLLERFEFK